MPEHAKYNTINDSKFKFVGFTMGPEQLFTNVARLNKYHTTMSSISNQLGSDWPKISLDQAAESVSLHEYIHAGINEKQLKIFEKPNDYNWKDIKPEAPGLKIQNINNIQVDEMIAFSFSFADNINTIIPELYDNHVDNLDDPTANYALKANVLNQILIKVLNSKGLDGQKIMREFKNEMEFIKKDFDKKFAENENPQETRRLEIEEESQKTVAVVKLLSNLNKREDIVLIQKEFLRVSEVMLKEIRRVKSKAH
jgi:hypothetical protein